MELDTSSIEKRFAFGFLQQLLRWMDISQEFIAHLGTQNSLPMPTLPAGAPRGPVSCLSPSSPHLLSVPDTVLGVDNTAVNETEISATYSPGVASDSERQKSRDPFAC